IVLHQDQEIEQVPPPGVIYPHGLVQPAVLDHDAIVAALSLELHRLQLQDAPEPESSSSAGSEEEDIIQIAACIYLPTPASLLEVVRLPLSLGDLEQC
ncbi:Anamorsin-like protein, partial [Frankliniella fusca]